MRHLLRLRGRGIRGDRTELASSWRTWLPYVFIIFSLSALLLIPLLLERRVSALRRQVVDVLEPARLTLGRIELGFAREAVALRNFLLTADPQFLAVHQSLRDDERERLRRLERRLALIDPDLVEHVGALRDVAEAWRAEQLALLRSNVSANEFLRRDSPQRIDAERLLQPALRLDAELAALARERRTEVRRIERLERNATALLALLAIISALLVAHTARSLRRRARQEQALRHAALTLTEAVDLEDVLRRITRAAISMDGGDSAYVERITSDRTAAEVVASTGSFAPPVGMRAAYPGSLSERAIRTGLPEVVSAAAPDERPMLGALQRTAARCPALAVPLNVESETEGALVLLRAVGRRPYGPADLAQARIFGALAALAVRKAVLLARAEERSAALQRATEGRARLIRGFAHDLKNPLGAAEGLAALLEEGVIQDANGQRETVGRIRASLRSALGLITDLVELARAEAGRLRIRTEPVDIGELVRKVGEEFLGAAVAARHNLRVEIPPELPQLQTDAARVQQVLENLLSNAIKYTPAGGNIVLRAAVRDAHPGREPQRWVALSVSDNGPGIPADQQRQLFQEFTRLETGVEAGSGLGLAISQRIAEALGGEIALYSEPGRGSTFTLSLPAT